MRRQRVAPGGKLFIALYNDTGSQSARWYWIKKTYNGLPGILKNAVRGPRVDSG